MIPCITFIYTYTSVMIPTIILIVIKTTMNFQAEHVINSSMLIMTSFVDALMVPGETDGSVCGPVYGSRHKGTKHQPRFLFRGLLSCHQIFQLQSETFFVSMFYKSHNSYMRNFICHPYLTLKTLPKLSWFQ